MSFSSGRKLFLWFRYLMLHLVRENKKSKHTIFFFIYIVKWNKRNTTPYRWGQWTQMLGPGSGRWSCECIPEIVKRERRKKIKGTSWMRCQADPKNKGSVPLTRHLHNTFKINCSYLSQKKSVSKTMYSRGRFLIWLL